MGIESLARSPGQRDAPVASAAERQREHIRAQIRAHFEPWKRSSSPRRKRGPSRRILRFRRSPAPLDGPRFRVAATVLLVLFTATVMGPMGFSQSVSLDPGPNSTFWTANAPQERGGPLRHGHAHVDLMSGAGPSVLWQVGGFKAFLAAPIMDNENAYVADRGGNVSAINLSTGRIVWSTDVSGTVSAAPAVAYGWVYVATEGKKLFALSARTGVQIRSATLLGEAHVSPLAADGRIYQGTEAGVMQVFDGSTLDELWRFDTATTKFDTVNNTAVVDKKLQKPIRAPIAFHDGRVYVAGMNGWLYALSATGNVHGHPTLHWKTQLDNAPITATPAVDFRNSRVIVGGGNGELIALKMTDGKLAWKLDVGEAITAGAAIGPNRIVAGSVDGRIVATDTAGKLLWDRIESEGVFSGPMLTNDTAIVLGAEGTLLLLDPATGKVLKTAAGPAKWLLSDGSHTDVAVTRNGILATDLSGLVTFIGPQPSTRADLQARTLEVQGTLTPGAALNVTATATNLGPDTSHQVEAALLIDGVQETKATLGRLVKDGTLTWTTPLASGLSAGSHEIKVTFTPVGAVDPDPGTATLTKSVEVVSGAVGGNGSSDNPFADVVIGSDGFPHLPDGEIDWETYYAMQDYKAEQEAAAAALAEGNETEPGSVGLVGQLMDGFKGQLGILMVPAFLVALIGTAYIQLRRKPAPDGNASEAGDEGDEADEGEDWDDDWDE